MSNNATQDQECPEWNTCALLIAQYKPFTAKLTFKGAVSDF